MKTTKFAPQAKGFFMIIVAAMVIFSFNSCATKIPFLTSSVVPAAQGTVKVKKDGNKNYVIKVQLNSLAEPARLSPSKNTYVVWMETEENSAKNIGQVKSSSSLMSKQLKGSFETVSSFKPKKIFITGENDANVQYPSESDIVLTTNNF